MLRGVTVVRMCLYALALVLSLVLAVDGVSGTEARAESRDAATAPKTAVKTAGEGEQEHAERAVRRTGRYAAAPPVPGEHPPRTSVRWTAPVALPHGDGIPPTGTAGVPWRRSVPLPVLHEVFRR
ncbi:hypothetical protein GCM10009801_33360 [Streptomyces albiaxialis]|uniref:Secreted protein n=1 Tax=Streptomyces albiaxialis TaxID=329523 RepID=A0ABN2VYG6_9ACTN